MEKWQVEAIFGRCTEKRLVPPEAHPYFGQNSSCGYHPRKEWIAKILLQRIVAVFIRFF